MSSPGHNSKTVIVGASLAGLRCAASLRREGYEGEIVLLGSERHAPYQRPPLSKAILTGRAPIERATLRSQVAPPFELRLGVSATALDSENQIVTLDDRSSISYDHLVLTCGARPRRLSILPPSETVLYFRTLDDAIRLRSRLQESIGRLLVVGAGFIGSEIASSAREQNWQVTLVDLDSRIMSRVLGERASSIVEQRHRKNGIDLRLNDSIRDAEIDRNGEHSRVSLSGGSTLDVDMIVVGIGVEANTEWLAGSSLKLDNGVTVDAHGRAEGVNNIYAAGDVSSWFHPAYGRHLRFEHFESATNQAQKVAATIVGTDPSPLDELPFAWSDQHGSVIQFLGLPDPSYLERPLEFSDESPHGQAFGYYDDHGRCRAAVLIDQSAHLGEVKSTITQNLSSL
ncbi:MAG: NAD(P)/FAD-dependent oxidoreductase [Acidimicrobiales bacterium]